MPLGIFRVVMFWGSTWWPWRVTETSDGDPTLWAVTHYASERLLLNSAFKSGRRVTMATIAHVPCETSLGAGRVRNGRGGEGPSAKPGRFHVTGAAAAQKTLRRPRHRDAQETQSESKYVTSRYVKTPAQCARGAAFSGMKSGMGFSQGLQIKSSKSNLLCDRCCSEACD